MISRSETMVYQQVGGMQIMPSNQQAEAFTTQLHKKPIEASREDFNRIIAKIDAIFSKIFPKDMISSIQRQDSNQSMSITPNDATNFNQLSETTAAAEKIKPSSLSSLTPKTRKRKRPIPLEYS
ncbi:unnamed protein product, partial [Brassica rapa subsp. trilocularis]